MKKTCNTIIRSEEDKHEFMLNVARLMKQIGEIQKPIQAEFRLKSLAKARTNAQNRLLWGVIYPQICSAIFLKTGKEIDAETLHDYYFKPRFCGKEIITMNGKPLTIAKSSKELSVSEFNEAIEKLITTMATEYGIYVELEEYDNENSLFMFERNNSIR